MFKIYLIFSPNKEKIQAALFRACNSIEHFIYSYKAIHRTDSYNEQKKNLFSYYVLCIMQCTEIEVVSSNVFIFLRVAYFICMHKASND